MLGPKRVSSWHSATFAFTTAVCVVLSGASADAKATYVTFDAGFVTSINSTNAVAGYNATDGFIRTSDGTVTTFDVTGAVATQAWAIDDAGVSAGYYFDDLGANHGFVRAPDGTITTFDGPKASNTVAYHINNKGEITGRYTDDAGEHAFVRRAGGHIMTIDVPNAVETDPGCINDKSVIAGSYVDSEHLYHGFLRTADGTITTFDVPGAVGTIGGCINAKAPSQVTMATETAGTVSSAAWMERLRPSTNRIAIFIQAASTAGAWSPAGVRIERSQIISAASSGTPTEISANSAFQTAARAPCPSG